MNQITQFVNKLILQAEIKAYTFLSKRNKKKYYVVAEGFVYKIQNGEITVFPPPNK